MPSPPIRRALSTLAALAILASPDVITAQVTCQPPVHNSPCTQGDPATFPGAEPQLNLGIGNPVHLASGNKFQHEVDLPARLDGRLPALARIYSAMDPRSGILGPGWQLAIDNRLVRRNNQWHLVQAGGHPVRFDRIEGPSVPAGSGTLHADEAGYRWAWPDGTEHVFDRDGRLIRIRRPGTRDIVLARHSDPRLSGAISSITQGPLAIRLTYEHSGPHPRLRHADTPAGRFSYHYEAAIHSSHSRLIRVTRPDGMQRHYLYEPDWQAGNHDALTGIVLGAPDGRTLRIRSWTYDAQARVVRSSTGAHGQGTGGLDIEYLRPATHLRPGHTRVRHGAGLVSDFTFSIKGGRHVLLSADGAPCPGCPVPGTRARYDDQGRLAELNGTRLSRDEAGRLTRIEPGDSGWPGLMLDHDAQGRRSAWASALTGQTRTRFNHQGLPSQIDYANGNRLSIAYDAQGRPVQMVARRGPRAERTGLSWRGRLLAGIQHPAENETREYDAKGRLAHHRIERLPEPGRPGLAYTEFFEYDSRDRMARHTLPEGGALHYEWGEGARLMSITWETPSGAMRPVIRQVAGLPGYRYGNGLHLGTYADQRGRTDTLVLSRDTNPLWVARRSHDTQGRVTHVRHDMPEAGFSRAWHHAYDAASRLIGVRGQVRTNATADPADAPSEWLAWAADGSLARRRTASGQTPPTILRDASGLPTAVQDLIPAYGPQRRLVKVHQNGRLLVRYTHNAFGHQIRRQTPDSATELLYLGNRVVAEGRSAAGAKDGLRVTRRYIYAHEVPVGMIDYRGEDEPQLLAIHADLLGAPHMVTDMHQTVRWLADYTPGGVASRISGDLELDLRLPGQLHDPATGWHDNVFRTYMPRAMQYLEPDPLGPLPGHQALGYAAQQPQRYVDPLGLLLMAFDGTRNDRQTGSNIWKLSQYYRDGPVFYHSGPGNEAYLDWDALTAWTADQTVRTQWMSLMNALSTASRTAHTTPIDILGFSRGAALARHFANEITRHTRDGWFSYEDSRHGTIGLCVSLRFMGLFDTVAQFGLLGLNNAGYDLGISAAWQWVSHAVALNERRGIFPLVSASPQEHWNTVEAPFIGAHADIGGGILFDNSRQPLRRGDLSDIALNWMLWQARAAQVAFDDPSQADRSVSLPILHDERGTTSRLLDGDRAIQDSRGLSTAITQGQHAILGDDQRKVFERYIQRVDGWRTTSGSEVGEVDMRGYGQWLEESLGMPPI